MDPFETALGEARSALAAHDSGHLALSHRVKLMHALGDPTATNRVFLECAKQVYPLWIADNSNDSAVREMLEAAQSHLDGEVIDAARLTALADRARGDMEASAEVSALAGLCATSLCYSIASNAAGMLSIERDVSVDDGDFDWDVWNPDFYASIAASGGNLFVGAGDAARRREFWRWYLDTVSQVHAGPLAASELSPVATDTAITRTVRTQDHELPAITDAISKVIDLCVKDLESAGISAWDQLVLTGECMKGGLAMKGRYELDAVEHDFKLKYYLYKGDESSVQLMNQVKRLMYDQAPREGAWMQFTIVVDKDSRATPTFNYDDFESLPANRTDAAGLADEFKAFPRSQEFTPPWWQAIVAKKKLSYS